MHELDFVFEVLFGALHQKKVNKKIDNKKDDVLNEIVYELKRPEYLAVEVASIAHIHVV